MSESRCATVVLLPGIDGTGELLAPVAQHIAERREVRIIAFPADQCLGYDELLSYVRERLPEGPLVLVGESFSGPLAIMLAAHEARVRGVVLAASFARHPWPSGFASVARIADLKRAPLPLINAVLFGRTGTARLRGDVKRLRAKLPSAVLRARTVAVLQVDARALLRELRCPVLLLHGRSDWLVQRRLVVEAARLARSPEVVWLDGAHMILETHAPLAAGLILRFTERAEAPA